MVNALKRFICLGGVLIISQVTHADVTLTANGTTHEENSSIQLVCNIPQDTDDYALWWKTAKDGSEDKVLTIVNNGSHCNTFVPNVPGPPPSYMECSCRSRVYTCVIKGLTRNNDSDQWRCSSQNAGQTAYSNYFTIQVVVGITGVTLSQVPAVKIIADTTGTLVCKTSGGRPAAIITWFRETSTGDVNITSQSSSVTSVQAGLSVVTSTLSQRPSRNDNSARIYCNASNGGKMYRSQTSTIDVLYGPDPPVCTYQGSAVTGTIKITRGSTLNITCTSTSNPPSFTYRWTLPDSSTLTGSQLSVADIQPSLSGQYRLQVSNTMTPTVGAAVTGTNSTTIAVDVQYPPSAPTFKIGNVTVFGTIGIIAGNTLTISCYSQSNPPPTSYSWTPGGARNSADLVLSNVQNPESNGPYTCTAENTMTTTGDKYVTAQSSSIANIEVLYDTTTAKDTGVPVAGIVGGILSACILIVIVSTVVCLKRKYDVRCTLKRQENLKEGHTKPRSDKTTGDEGAYTSIQHDLEESSHRYSTPTSIPEQQIVRGDEMLNTQKSKLYENMVEHEGYGNTGHPQQNTPANEYVCYVAIISVLLALSRTNH